MSAEVRRLDVSELDDASALVAAEGWTFVPEDLARLHRLGGAVGARDAQGKLVGFLSFVDFAPVRWVGNVVVLPEARGEGLGARMVADVARDARTVGLYSVEKAVTLYERAGFVTQGETWAMRAEAARPARPSVTEPMRQEDLREAARLDRDMTGMDRGYLLREMFRAWPSAMRVVRRGGRVVAFGGAKLYADVTDLGPIVAPRAEDAAALWDAIIAVTDGPHEVAVPSENAAAMAAARERGFTPSFRTITMFRGQPPGWKPDAMHATAGLEKG